MRITFTITFAYDIVTHESVENGEFENGGFNNITQKLVELNYNICGLKQAVLKAKSLGCYYPNFSPISRVRIKEKNNIIWFSSDGKQCPFTGDIIIYNFHLSEISDKTLIRVCRALGVNVD